MIVLMALAERRSVAVLDLLGLASVNHERLTFLRMSGILWVHRVIFVVVVVASTCLWGGRLYLARGLEGSLVHFFTIDPA